MEDPMGSHPVIQQKQDSNVTHGVVKRGLELVASMVLQGAMLFISAGRLDWVMGWVYIAIYLGVVGINSLVLIPRNPELIAERAQPKENTKGWDKTISGLVGVAFLGSLVIAGLDVRFKWSPEAAVAVLVAGTVLLVLGNVLFSWAMISNAFFSTLVRIQEDRSHTVATNGPYRFVRHPGYVGWILMSFGIPIMLGSLWAVIPGALSALLMVVRTALEDRTLQNELPGYKDYAAQVRYRLLPGVW
jgi:protein-S-isoprenylcysteine O-methyltransferase Ste14